MRRGENAERLICLDHPAVAEPGGRDEFRHPFTLLTRIGGECQSQLTPPPEQPRNLPQAVTLAVHRCVALGRLTQHFYRRIDAGHIPCLAASIWIATPGPHPTSSTLSSAARPTGQRPRRHGVDRCVPG